MKTLTQMEIIQEYIQKMFKNTFGDRIWIQKSTLRSLSFSMEKATRGHSPDAIFNWVDAKTNAFLRDIKKRMAAMGIESKKDGL